MLVAAVVEVMLLMEDLLHLLQVVLVVVDQQELLQELPESLIVAAVAEVGLQLVLVMVVLADLVLLF
jgi:hypothetical protein